MKMFATNCLTTSQLLVLAALLVAQSALCANLETHVLVSTAAPETSSRAHLEVGHSKAAPLTNEHSGKRADPIQPVPTGGAHPPASTPPHHALHEPQAATEAPMTVVKVNKTTTSESTDSRSSHAASSKSGLTDLVLEHFGFAAPQKLAQYFEPICRDLDRLLPDHVFKIASQLKQFIEKTAGKMSVCFMQHFLMDPNLTPVNTDQLSSICASRNMPAGTKGSFQAFQGCSENHWDKNLGMELDRILETRSNCFYNHAHSADDSRISLIHDSDDIILVSEVVGKVLNDDKSIPIPKSNIQMFDVGSSPNGMPTDGNLNQPASGMSDKSKKIMNDPNTLLVLVDDSKRPTSAPTNGTASLAKLVPTASPIHHQATPTKPAEPAKVNLHVESNVKTTLKPAPIVSTKVTTLAPKISKLEVTLAAKSNTTLKPAAKLPDKITVTVTTNAPQKPVVASTVSPIGVIIKTKAPIAIVSTTKAPPTIKVVPTTVKSLQTTFKPMKTTVKPVPTTVKPVPTIVKQMPTTVKPIPTTTKPIPTTTKPIPTTTKPMPTTVKPIPTTAKPITQHPTISHAVEIVSQSTTRKPATKTPSTRIPSKASNTTSKSISSLIVKTTPISQSTTKAPVKDADKLKKEREDANNAIKALKAQQAGHVDDAWMHQIEHQRQMHMDPVGHTLKHQKYEELKKQKASTKAPQSS